MKRTRAQNVIDAILVLVCACFLWFLWAAGTGRLDALVERIVP